MHANISMNAQVAVHYLNLCRETVAYIALMDQLSAHRNNRMVDVVDSNINSLDDEAMKNYFLLALQFLALLCSSY